MIDEPARYFVPAEIYDKVVAERDALRKDAERYRKLRDLQPGVFTGLFIAKQRVMFGQMKYVGPLFGEFLDKEVDAVEGAP